MKKNWIWIAVTITLLGLGLVIAGLYLSKKWKPILEEKLNEQIAASSDGLYTLGYQEMNTNLLTAVSPSRTQRWRLTQASMPACYRLARRLSFISMVI